MIESLGGLAMGLVASAHCGAMCGAVVGSCAQGGGVSRLAAFQVGRLAGYTVLGAVCGAAGALVDLGATALYLPRLAAIVAGLLLVAIALEQLGVKLPGRRSGGARAPGGALLARALALRGPVAPFAVGASLAVLPCGVLYGAAAVAAGSADPLRGALFMASFALGGALPLTALGAAFRWAWARGQGTLLNRLCAVTILSLGIWTLAGRALPVPGAASHSHPPHHHHMEGSHR